MSKGGLRFLATVLTTGILVVPFLGLDDLPRGLQRSIDAERKAYTEARATIQRARGSVEQDLRAEPALFRAHSMNTVFPERLRKAEGSLAAADRDMAALARLREANRRGDRAEAERLLKQEQSERSAAQSEATAIEAEARRWVDLKRNLPQTLEQMRADADALRAADLSQVTGVVQKAQIDWPEKKADLQSRLDALRAMPGEAERIWQQTEPQRRLAAAGDYANLDAGALISGVVSLHNARAALPARTEELRSLAGQLYDSWDKVLVDLDTEGMGGSRAYREKIRTIRTHYDAPGTKDPRVSTNEQWVEVSRPQYAAVEKNLGMAIEHKAAGRYDTEAERTAQPPGFAYMAPPGQERNQYGYWDHRGGQSFWVWYGQYALMRDLLFNRDYRAPDTREWENYRSSQRRGQTYYGRDETTQAPRYGTTGSATQSRYSGSTYARRGGFSDSKYATRGYREHPDEVAPRRFGGRSSDGNGIFSSSRSRSWSPPRSSSRPSFGGGGGRRFGGGGRRR